MNRLFYKKSFEQVKKQDAQNLMHRSLNLKDLLMLGIAAIIGTGIFTTIGPAAYHAGPSVVLVFIATAIVCVFVGFPYAQLSSMIPQSGGSYVYAYLALGEFCAWIVGWVLGAEYAIGNILTAMSWSDYFTALLKQIEISALNIHAGDLSIPTWLSTSYQMASNAFAHSLDVNFDTKAIHTESLSAWHTAPTFLGIKFIADIPAIFSVLLITILVYIGIKESKKAAEFMVWLKMLVILGVIGIGAFFVEVKNYIPFAPNGFAGMTASISSVFFAYIGFDAISSVAEECKNPQKDLPKGIIYSIGICTVLYIAVALVVTGMVDYKILNTGEPLLIAFAPLQWKSLSFILAISAVVAMSSILLVYQLGQPRIWMNMSRDGLLPKRFAEIHPKYKTPAFATVVTGFVVAVPILFFDMQTLTDMASMGTLLALGMVCLAYIALQKIPQEGLNIAQASFKIPQFSARLFLPIACAISVFLEYRYGNQFNKLNYLMIFWWLNLIILTAYAWHGKLDFAAIPAIGYISCLYMMCQLSVESWSIFLVWLGFGVIIYFAYGYRQKK